MGEKPVLLLSGRLFLEEFRLVAQLLGRLAEVLLAEGGEVGDGREAVLLGDFGQCLFGHGDVAVEQFHFLAGAPAVCRLAEGLLEAAFEGVDADVGQGGELVQVVHLEVVGVDKVLEVLVPADDGEEELGQFLLAVIGAEEDEQFLLFQFVEVRAAQSFDEAFAHEPAVVHYALVHGEQLELVGVVVGQVLRQLLEGELIAEGDALREAAADGDAGLDGLGVAVGVAGQEGHVSGGVQDFLRVVARYVDFAFEHEDDGRFLCVDNVIGFVARIAGGDQPRLRRYAVVQAIAVFFGV